MSPIDIVAQASSALVFTVFSAVLGVVGAGALALFGVQGRRFPGAALVLPVALPIGAVAVVSIGADPASSLVARLASPLLVAPVLVIQGLAGALIAWRTPTRAWVPVGAGAVIALLTAGVIVAQGVVLDDEALCGARAVACLVAAAWVAPSWVAGPDDGHAGVESAAAAMSGWAVFVATTEVAARAMGELIAVIGLHAAGDGAPEIARRFHADVLQAMAPWAVASVAVAALALPLALIATRPGGARAATALSGAWVTLLALALLIVGSLGPDALLAAASR